MTDYGVFATLAATVSSLVAVAGAIRFGFQKRAIWQPPEEAVPLAVSRLASLLTCVGVALLYVFAGGMPRWALGGLAVLLFIVALRAYLTASSVNIEHGYYYPSKPIEKNRKLGGNVLTSEAAMIQKERGLGEKQLYADARGDKDLVWTRKSQASVQRRSALSFILLIGCGACCLAAAGMLVATTIQQAENAQSE